MAATRERVGRPTQFHGVPLEERAFDSQGNRLPWALEWADDHPNARLQKRQPEEKGSFGKSTRRKGSSRGTRTQTPAKKENLTLDGFEAALAYDAQNEPQKQLPSTGLNVPDTTHHVGPSLTKEPMQVMLYGYSPETQWAAIQFYESVSGGIICEDYERVPPVERRRFQNGLGYSGHMRPRALTKAEKASAMQYRGGSCWIKVTFDSIEAGERAIYNSPHPIQGHLVHAQAYRGQAPDIDEPMPLTEEVQTQVLLGGGKSDRRPPQTLGASFSLPSLQGRDVTQRGTTTLPRSFTVTGNTEEQPMQQLSEDASLSSSTASSATALGPEQAMLHHRTSTSLFTEIRSPDARETAIVQPSRRPKTFTHFPDTPRTLLKPAAEAFLPQSSWTERLSRQLSHSGWIPGDIIGNAVPRLENGAFDWTNASFYWKVCYWLDTTFGMDLCGIKES